MSDYIVLPKLKINDYFSHLKLLGSRLCKVYKVSASNTKLKSFKAKRKEIKESEMTLDEEKLADLEKILLKLFKSIDKKFFESSEWKTTLLSEWKEGEIIRSKTLEIIERKVNQIEIEGHESSEKKAEEVKQKNKNNEDCKEDKNEDLNKIILNFLYKEKSEEDEENFRHLINWAKIYLYL